VIYIYERAPRIEEVVATSEEEARRILDGYYGGDPDWKLIDTRGEIVSRRLLTTEE
jgi:hypothetical protein